MWDRCLIIGAHTGYGMTFLSAGCLNGNHWTRNTQFSTCVVNHWELHWVEQDQCNSGTNCHLQSFCVLSDHSSSFWLVTSRLLRMKVTFGRGMPFPQRSCSLTKTTCLVFLYMFGAKLRPTSNTILLKSKILTKAIHNCVAWFEQESSALRTCNKFGQFAETEERHCKT